MYRNEANDKILRVFQLGIEYERLNMQERRCVSGSKKSLEYRDKMATCIKERARIWDEIKYYFDLHPYAFTPTDFAANRQ